MKKYYKVVRVLQGELISFNSSAMKWDNSLRKACVKYNLDKWIYPSLPKSCLFVFDDLNKALSYASFCCCGVNQFVVYECEVNSPVKAAKLVKPAHCDEIQTEYWERVDKAITHHKSKDYYLNKWAFAPTPNGTVWCKALKLIKRINQ